MIACSATLLDFANELVVYARNLAPEFMAEISATGKYDDSVVNKFEEIIASFFDKSSYSK